MKLFAQGYEFIHPNIDGLELTFSKGEYLFKEGETEDGVFFIDRGSVRIIKEKWVLWTAKSKELIGVSSFFSDGTKYRFSAKADNDCKIVKISHEEFEEILLKNTGFGKAVMEMMCDRINFTTNRLGSVMTKTSRSRLINEIISRSSQLDSLTITYSSEELSELVGVSERMVRSNLKELERRSFIKRDKKNIIILDMKGLKIIAEKIF